MLSYLWLNARVSCRKIHGGGKVHADKLPLFLRKTPQKGSPAWASLQCSWARLSARCGEERTVAARVQRGYEKVYAPCKTQHPIELLTLVLGEAVWDLLCRALRSSWLGIRKLVSSHLHPGTSSTWSFSPCPQILLFLTLTWSLLDVLMFQLPACL